jgi:hypothetical protein
MDWVKERDALIAQTVAFVQSVTGRKPDFATTPIRVTALENSAPLENPHAAKQSLTLEAATLEAAELFDQSGALPPNRAFPQGDVRKDIQNRVAAFQAHQHRFQRDRDVYFTSVLAKARAEIENSAEISPPGSANR